MIVALLQVLLYYYCFALGLLLLSRIFNRSKPTLKEKKLMIVFGSGGHTTEMLLMLTKLNQFDFSKYKEVQFVIGHSDTWSITKIKDYFSRGTAKPFDVTQDVSNVKVIKLFRSREVKQSYMTSILTTIVALVHSVYIVARSRPDIVRFYSFYI